MTPLLLSLSLLAIYLSCPSECLTCGCSPEVSDFCSADNTCDAEVVAEKLRDLVRQLEVSGVFAGRKKRQVHSVDGQPLLPPQPPPGAGTPPPLPIRTPPPNFPPIGPPPIPSRPPRPPVVPPFPGNFTPPPLPTPPPPPGRPTEPPSTESSSTSSSSTPSSSSSPSTSTNGGSDPFELPDLSTDATPCDNLNNNVYKDVLLQQFTTGDYVPACAYFPREKQSSCTLAPAVNATNLTALQLKAVRKESALFWGCPTDNFGIINSGLEYSSESNLERFKNRNKKPEDGKKVSGASALGPNFMGGILSLMVVAVLRW